jgi:O-antigen ligase
MYSGTRWADETSVAAAAIGVWAAALATIPDATTRAMIAAPFAVFASLLLLPPLPIALGDSGPHVAPAVASLGVFVGLVRMNEWRAAGHPLTILLISFTAILTASVGLAAVYSGPEIAIHSFLRVLLFAITVYVFTYTLAGPEPSARFVFHQARLLFWMSAAAALFACIDFYYQLPAPAGYGPQFVWLPDGVFRRAQGLFYEASTLGNFCAFFLVMVVIALFRPAHQRPLSRMSLVAGGVLLSVALIVSYSRASLVTVAVAVIAFAYIRRVRLRRVLPALLGCAALATIAAYVVFPAFASTYWFRLTTSLQYFWSTPDGVLSGRLSTWTTLIDFVLREPWHILFGVGYKTLPYSDFVGERITADNTYLSLLVETGVIGLAVFVALNIAILRFGLRAARSENSRASFFGSWIFCFWMGQVVQMLSGDLITYWRVLPVYFWVLAIAVRETGRDEHPVR